MTPQTGSLLLDTNAAIAATKPTASLAAIIGAAPVNFIPFAALGELYFGAERSTRVAANLRRVQQFLRSVTVLFPDEKSVHEYGRIKNELRKKGRPIPENDIWIAALARRHGLPLLSRDQHFQEVAGLTLLSW